MHLPGMTVAQLLADESFINYCKGIEADTLYWEKFLEQNPEEKEVVASARQMFLDIFNAFAVSDLDEQVEKLSNSISTDTVAPVIPMPSQEEKTHRYSFIIKVAAALVVIIAGYFAFSSREREKQSELLMYSTQEGEKKTIQLTDGSVVMLNASSKIILTKKFGLADRRIQLVGEAFFDVKKNALLPFIVSTRSLDVKALGTAFNIKAYPGETKCETALIRGLIEVTLHNKAGTRLTLYPNQKVQWNNKEELKSKAIINDTTVSSSSAKHSIIKTLAPTEEGLVKELAWIENKLIFSGETFAEISPQLERWYGVTIVFADEVVSGFSFTATFEKETLQTVLDVLKESKDFNYKMIEGDKTIVKISR
jgi:ferric-dicitrate binding protein FerR (iron transport regulator)